MDKKFNLYPCKYDKSKVLVINTLAGETKKLADAVVDEKSLREFVLKTCRESAHLEDNFDIIYEYFVDDDRYADCDVQSDTALNVNLRIQEACQDSDFIMLCLNTWFPNLSDSIKNRLSMQTLTSDYYLFNFEDDLESNEVYNPLEFSDTFETEYDKRIYYDGGIWFTYDGGKKYIPFFALSDLQVLTDSTDIDDNKIISVYKAELYQDLCLKNDYNTKNDTAAQNNNVTNIDTFGISSIMTNCLKVKYSDHL